MIKLESVIFVIFVSSLAVIRWMFPVQTLLWAHLVFPLVPISMYIGIGGTLKSLKLLWPRSHPKCNYIVGYIVVVIYCNVDSKFGLDRMNISYENMLLKSKLNPGTFGDQKKKHDLMISFSPFMWKYLREICRYYGIDLCNLSFASNIVVYTYVTQQ